MKHYDSIVVGAGQAGPALARVLTEMGQKVALAEANKVGGSCVNYGCTPSKTIIASARAIYTANRGDEFGFDTGQRHGGFSPCDAAAAQNRDGYAETWRKKSGSDEGIDLLSRLKRTSSARMKCRWVTTKSRRKRFI